MRIENVETIGAGVGVDAWMAEFAMGWETVPGSEYRLWRDPGGGLMRRTIDFAREGGGVTRLPGHDFNPSTDRGDALELYERVAAKYGLGIEPTSEHLIGIGHAKWRVVDAGEYQTVIVGRADTLSLAICRAVCKCVVTRRGQ